MNDRADENGVWVWNEAPVDEFKADICPAGGNGMQLAQEPLIARKEEYVFKLPGALVVSGRVIDAVTRRPIKAYRVVPGVRWSETQMHWDQNHAFQVTDGHYQVRQTRNDFAHLIRIEADGYHAMISRDLKSTEGKVTLDFALKPGPNVAARILTPDQKPAQGARIALGIAGSQIMLRNGEFDKNSTFCEMNTSDRDGRFHFPAQDQNFQLVITHPTGFAQIRSTAEWDAEKTIQLEAWAKVEGTFRVGPKPKGKVSLSIRIFRADTFGEGEPRINTRHETTTGPDGTFAFDRVIPGQGQIGREISIELDSKGSMVTSSRLARIECLAGKVLALELGGNGRGVVGTLRAPEGFDGQPHWNYAFVSANSDDGKTGPYFSTGIDRDGSFRIDDLPEGSYLLKLDFQREPVGVLRDQHFQVPAPGRKEETLAPIDLGTLILKTSPPKTP